jgi:hypothetical protein
MACASDLRQIGQALVLYSADHNRRIPPNFADTAGGAYAGMARWRIRELAGSDTKVGLGRLVDDYIGVGSVGVFGSPNHSGYEPQTMIDQWQTGGPVDSARLYRETDHGVRPQLLRNSSQTAMIMDNSGTTSDAGHAHGYARTHVWMIDGSVDDRHNTNATSGDDQRYTHAADVDSIDRVWANADAGM